MRLQWKLMICLADPQHSVYVIFHTFFWLCVCCWYLAMLETTFLQHPVTQHQTKYIRDKHRVLEALPAQYYKLLQGPKWTSNLCRAALKCQKNRHVGMAGRKDDLYLCTEQKLLHYFMRVVAGEIWDHSVSLKVSIEMLKTFRKDSFWSDGRSLTRISAFCFFCPWRSSMFGISLQKLQKFYFSF